MPGSDLERSAEEGVTQLAAGERSDNLDGYLQDDEGTPPMRMNRRGSSRIEGSQKSY